jgi:hypothetical protein
MIEPVLIPGSSLGQPVEEGEAMLVVDVILAGIVAPKARIPFTTDRGRLTVVDCPSNVSCAVLWLWIVPHGIMENESGKITVLQYGMEDGLKGNLSA